MEYKIGKNNFEFKLFDKSQKSKFSYNGKLNFKPFHSYLTGSALEINFFHLFSSNAIIKELLKTKILNNKNIDFKLSISANKVKNFENYTNIFLKSKIQEELISEKDYQKLQNMIETNFVNSNSSIEGIANSLAEYYAFYKDTNLINSEIKIYR